LDKLTIEHCHRLAILNNGECLSTKYINSKTKYLWRCSNNHVWESIYNIIQRNHWCPKCAGNKTLTIDDYHALAKKYCGECLNLEFTTSKAKYHWKCKFGHEWESTYANIRKGGWCQQCKNVTNESCHNLAKDRGGEWLSPKYLGPNTKYLWKCSEGHTWETMYANVNYGRWCHICYRNNRRLTIQHCQNIAKKKNGKCLSNDYINNKTKYIWQCSKNHKWEATYNSVKNGSWCPDCSSRRKLTIEHCRKSAASRGGECLSLIYINNGTKYLWRCSNNHEWRATYDKIKQGKWCPKCKTKTQARIFGICKELFPDFQIFYNYRNFKWLKYKKFGKLELDIYIPELKLAIEYDGEQHAGPIRFGGISLEKAKKNFVLQQERDKYKDKLMKENINDIRYFIRIPAQSFVKKDIINIIYRALKMPQIN